jgi:hypothetical protein
LARLGVHCGIAGGVVAGHRQLLAALGGNAHHIGQGFVGTRPARRCLWRRDLTTPSSTRM